MPPSPPAPPPYHGERENGSRGAPQETWKYSLQQGAPPAGGPVPCTRDLGGEEVLLNSLPAGKAGWNRMEHVAIDVWMQLELPQANSSDFLGRARRQSIESNRRSSESPESVRSRARARARARAKR